MKKRADKKRKKWIWAIWFLMAASCLWPSFTAGAWPDTDAPVLAQLDMENGKTWYIVDHLQYVPPDISWEYRLVKDSYADRQITFFTDQEEDVRILYLMNEAGEFSPYAYNNDSGMFYPCYTMVRDGRLYLYMSPDACRTRPEGLNGLTGQKNSLFFAVDMWGYSNFYRMDKTGRVFAWNEHPEETENGMDQTEKLILILTLAIGAVILTFSSLYFLELGRKRKRFQKMLGMEAEEGDLTIEDWSLDDPGNDGQEIGWPGNDQADPEGGYELPVISVQDVTMIFKVSTSNASGIKEYLIQRLKRQVAFRELVALNHVDFDIYQGEVVGIIGTNGSGKSTLLRIISGALRPTGGRVIVDQRKVQLLTLGTGFDMELSARENVYLNGSIIGYSREFLDEHYDEIVAFAELSDFMGEKVKNFSSGMVSRLGFAIATAGDAAEILILDEVLSVGDEFFRRKSLKRIHEMIHGGSTVLMVSHGMGTIIDNCTKAIWIEKGEMRLIGEPKEVCRAYQKQNG